jgi:hypothetical protein
MELDLQSYLGSMCTTVLICDSASPPPPPAFGLIYTRALLVSRERRHLFVTPCSIEMLRRFLGTQMTLAYPLDAISQGPKNSRFPGPNPLPLAAEPIIIGLSLYKVFRMRIGLVRIRIWLRIQFHHKWHKWK